MVFIAGFFIDFIEIVFILVPIVTPVFISMDVDLVWIGILLALSNIFFNTPFGFALFYLKGVTPSEIKTKQLYIGILPFVIIQIVFLGILILFPQLLKVF